MKVQRLVYTDFLVLRDKSEDYAKQDTLGIIGIDIIDILSYLHMQNFFQRIKATLFTYKVFHLSRVKFQLKKLSRCQLKYKSFARLLAKIYYQLKIIQEILSIKIKIVTFPVMNYYSLVSLYFLLYKLQQISQFSLYFLLSFSLSYPKCLIYSLNVFTCQRDMYL